MQMTLRPCTLALAISAVLSAPAAQAVDVFYEDFYDEASGACNGFPSGAGTYPFPPGWFLRNVDNAMPAGSVAYVNAAWRVREDFNFNLNECVAFSTSYYAPATSANDWMWTPLIGPIPAGGQLSWRAVTYDPSYRDGYEVRVMTSVSGPPTGGTGVIGNQITSSTTVFSTAAESTAWTPHILGLAAYTGQSIYIGFRNNSVNKFLLLVDDVRVFGPSPNLSANTPRRALPYARVPHGFAYVPDLSVTAANFGGTDLTNVIADAQLVHDTAELPGTVASAVVSTLAIGATAPMVFPTPLPAMVGDGDWSVSYVVNATEAEANYLDNSANSSISVVGGNELARFEGGVSGHLGIGAGNGGEMGVQFTLPAQATIVGVHFAVGPNPETAEPDPPDNWLGHDLVVNLRPLDIGTGKPGATILATTVAVPTSREGGVYDQPFVAGPQTLAAGTYVATLVEPTGTDAMPLSLHIGRYEPSTGWVNWPTSPAGGWVNLEFFGIAYQRAPEISLLTDLALFADGFETAAAGRRSQRTHQALSTATTPVSRRRASRALAVPEQ